jgi:hypothetical protein
MKVNNSKNGYNKNSKKFYDARIKYTSLLYNY